MLSICHETAKSIPRDDFISIRDYIPAIPFEQHGIQYFQAKLNVKLCSPYFSLDGNIYFVIKHEVLSCDLPIAIVSEAFSLLPC